MLKIYFILFLEILSLTFLAAQNTTFSKVISGLPFPTGFGLGIVEIEDGYLLHGSGLCILDNNNICTQLSKMDFKGNIIWAKEYEISATKSKAILVVNDKIYLAGSTNKGEKQIILCCLDLEGNILWQKTYGDPTKREGNTAIIKTDDNHLIISASLDRNIPVPNTWQPLMIKLNLEGDSLAQFKFNEQYLATINRRLFQDSYGRLLSSYNFCPSGGCFNLKAGVTCFDFDDGIYFQTEFNWAYQGENYSTIQVDSNTIVSSWYSQDKTNNFDPNPPSLYFMDMNGSVEDSIVFKNKNKNEIINLLAVKNNGLVGIGTKHEIYTNQYISPRAAWLFRMDKDKAILWDRTIVDTSFGGFAYENLGLLDIITAKDGGYIAIGTIQNKINGNENVHQWILKIDSMGCLTPNCLENTYITKSEEIIYQAGKNIKVFPNPTTDYLNVVFPDEFQTREVKLSIFDYSGKLVQQIMVENSHQIIQFSANTSGPLILVVSRNNEILTRRTILRIDHK